MNKEYDSRVIFLIKLGRTCSQFDDCFESSVRPTQEKQYFAKLLKSVDGTRFYRVFSLRKTISDNKHDPEHSIFVREALNIGQIWSKPTISYKTMKKIEERAHIETEYINQFI